MRSPFFVGRYMEKKTFKDYINQKKLYKYYSFVIAAFLMLIIFLFNKMNGKDYLIIRSDFFDSVGFLKEAVNNIANYNSIFFNNTTGLGLNNIMVVSGLFSPFNLIYLIFRNAKIDIVTMFVIILKVGLCAFSFQFYSNKVLKNDSFFSVIISVFYALNAYVIEYGTIHNSWIDALIIVPFLCYAVVECVERNKRVFLIILYSYIFISNFYLGYIIGFFSLLYIILYLVLIYKNESTSVKQLLSKFFNWVLGVVIAVMLSACIWVPTLFFIASNRVPDSSEIVQFNVTVLQILNSLFWGMSYGIQGTYSYIYCGVPILILVPLFFLNKSVNNKTKIFYGILTLTILISMVSRGLNSFWHVFDQPDDFWYRYAFLFCFVLCSVASKQLLVFEEQNKKAFIYLAGILCLFYQFILHTLGLWNLDVGVLNTNFGFIINFLLIVFWSVSLCYLFVVKKYKVFFLIVSFLVMSLEIVSLSKREISNLINAKAYYLWTDNVDEVVQEIKASDNDYYRTIIAKNNAGYNMDTFFGLYGIGDFGNQEKYGVRRFLSNVGFATSPRVTLESGYNPVANMLLGIKYLIYAPDIIIKDNAEEDSEETEILSTDKELEASYEVNEYALNLGYLVDGELILFEYPGRDVFENMNELVSELSGSDEDCYVQIPLEEAQMDANGIELVEMDTGEFVFTRNGSEGSMVISVPKGDYNKAFIQFEKSDSSLYSMDFNYLNTENSSNIVGNRLSLSSAIEMSLNEAGDRFEINIVSYEPECSDIFVCDNINIYYLDENALKNQYDILSSGQMKLNSYSNGHIDGTIHIEGENRLLLTTIPYDPGWRVFINGIETETVRVIDGTFIAVYLPGEGDYNVVLDFECPGLRIGVIVSVCGILALLSVIFEKQLKMSNKKNKK